MIFKNNNFPYFNPLTAKVEENTDDFKNLRRMEASFLTKSVRNLWRDLQNIVSNYTKSWLILITYILV